MKFYDSVAYPKPKIIFRLNVKKNMKEEKKNKRGRHKQTTKKMTSKCILCLGCLEGGFV